MDLNTFQGFLTMDYYAILGVAPDAENIVIEAAFKALAKKYHPDVWKGEQQDADEKIKSINEAYSVLRDPQKRKKYDAELASENRQETMTIILKEKMT